MMGSHLEFFPLLSLPDDEFRLVIRYLNIKSKGNLKLASKACEERVMSNDSEMKSLKVCFSESNYKEEATFLSKTKLKHFKANYFKNIDLSVKFDKGGSLDHFTALLISQGVISQWSKNINHLDLIIGGGAYFLLDPELKLPSLKSIEFRGSKGERSCGNNTIDIPIIVNAILKKVENTLLNLSLNYSEIPFSIDIDSAKNLQLQKLTSNGIAIENIAPLIIYSQSSLEELVLNWSCTSAYCSSLFDSMQLNLKSFKARVISESVAASVIKSSCASLKYLELDIVRQDLGFELESKQLNLWELSGNCIPISIAASLIKSSTLTLKTVDIGLEQGRHKQGRKPKQSRLHLKFSKDPKVFNPEVHKFDGSDLLLKYPELQPEISQLLQVFSYWVEDKGC